MVVGTTLSDSTAPPVLTVEPAEVDLSPLKSIETITITFNMTNHGHETAYRIALDLPRSLPFLKFNLNNQLQKSLGTLGPKSHAIFSVKVSKVEEIPVSQVMK